METLARAGFPALNRWSADRVGRIAYALGLGSFTWVVAAGDVLLDVPKNVPGAIVRAAGALLLSILPFLLARVAIPKNRHPLFADAGRQHIISIVFGVLGIVAIQTTIVMLDQVIEPPTHAGAPTFLGVAGILLIIGAIVVIPLAPVVHWANNISVGEDHAPRMRWRIGASLAANMMLRASVFYLFVGIPSEHMNPDDCVVFGSFYVVAALTLAIALFEIAHSLSVLVRTKSWIARARAGRITGVRVREEDGEELVDAPRLLHLAPSAGIALLETVPLDPTYRTASMPVPLGFVPGR